MEKDYILEYYILKDITNKMKVEQQHIDILKALNNIIDIKTSFINKIMNNDIKNIDSFSYSIIINLMEYIQDYIYEYMNILVD